MVTNAALINQISGETETFRKYFVNLLNKPDLERVRIAVAYARWDGIGHLSREIESFVESGGRFECIFGFANGVTTADALYYGLLLEKLFPTLTYTGFVKDKYFNASFHPKYYEFRFANETILLTGSANLTGGGLCRNGEVGIEVRIPKEDNVILELEEFWKKTKKIAQRATQKSVAKVANDLSAGDERQNENKGNKEGKTFLPSKTKPAPKPLFKKILGIANLKRKDKEELLGGMVALTNQPQNFFLQIFDRETGGSKGGAGCAVQIPVAALGPFFGVGSKEKREIRIDFPSITIRPTFMHLLNNTHRIRIKPILDIDRPAIIHFQRVDLHHFKASFIAQKHYAKTLKKECTQQSRANARKWGIR